MQIPVDCTEKFNSNQIYYETPEKAKRKYLGFICQPAPISFWQPKPECRNVP